MSDNASTTTGPHETMTQRKSVKELSAMYSGSSKAETQSQYERRMRVYEKVWSLTRYAGDKKALLKITSPMKRKLMEDWSSAIVEEQLELTLTDAEQFLAEKGVLPTTVGEEQWKEWEEAIIVATSPIRPYVMEVDTSIVPCKLDMTAAINDDEQTRDSSNKSCFSCCFRKSENKS